MNTPDQGCTNYDISTSENKSPALLFQSAEECCAFAYEGLDCSVRNSCELENSFIFAEWNFQLSEDSCESDWHPDLDYGRDGCSNAVSLVSISLIRVRDVLSCVF